MTTTSTPPPGPSRTRRSLFQALTDPQADFWTLAWRAFTLLLIIVVLLSVVWLAYRGGLDVSQLDKPEFMRGLITILLLVATLVLSTIVLLAVLFTAGDESAVKRTQAARDALTPLLGILGTIVGFYFGLNSQTVTPGAQPRQSPPTTQAVVAPEQ